MLADVLTCSLRVGFPVSVAGHNIPGSIQGYATFYIGDKTAARFWYQELQNISMLPYSVTPRIQGFTEGLLKARSLGF